MSDFDHLFLSYAWEDHVFARWLALRLTSEGYKVWLDQFKLLGGESWPKDINVAIKTRTFRMLGLLSRYSIDKPNPLKERTLALTLAKEPDRAGLLIPLNVDGLRPADLDWLTSDINFISFAASWEQGLRQLIKLLERERCPKFQGDGRAIVAALASVSDLVSSKPENLVSNASEFEQVPSHVETYMVSPSLSGNTLADAIRDWSFFPITPHRVVAFHPPPDDFKPWLYAESARSDNWRTTAEIDGVNSENIVVALLRRCIEIRCRSRGFIWQGHSDSYCCQLPFAKNLPVCLPTGARTTVQSSGQRTYFRIGSSKTLYRYWLAIRPTIVRNLMEEFSLVWKLSLHFTDTNNIAIPTSQRQSRRKHATRSWRNWHWLVRYLGVIQHLADEDGYIRIGPEGPAQVILKCSSLCFVAPIGIDETKLEKPEEISDEVPLEDEFDDITAAAEEEIDDDGQ